MRGGLWTALGRHLGGMKTGRPRARQRTPFSIPLIEYSGGDPIWLSGGRFGPEGGLPLRAQSRPRFSSRCGGHGKVRREAGSVVGAARWERNRHCLRHSTAGPSLCGHAFRGLDTATAPFVAISSAR